MARVIFDVQVGDENRAKALLAEVRDHLLEVWEILPVDCERRVSLLIIDIEVQDVGWNLFLA